VLQDDSNKRKKKRRPNAKPFDPEAIRAIGGEVTRDGDFLIFEGNRFSRKGFLYKNFTMSAILADGLYIDLYVNNERIMIPACSIK
jgi:transcription elongation factor SPT5